MKRLAVGPMTTPEYNEWWVRRINDNTPKLSQGNNQSIEDHLRVVPSKLEIIRQDFERRNEELEKKIEQMEEEKMNLRLDMDVQKLEAEKLRKGKNKAEEDLDSLKIDYKKLHQSIKIAGLGKTSDSAIKRFEKKRTKLIGGKGNSKRIEEMKKRIEELEAALQNYEIQIKNLEANEDRNNDQLHYFQNQVRNRDHIIGEAVVQIREVADHLQTLAVQADKLSVKYELESIRGPQQFQAGASIPMNFQAGLGSNPGDNLVNPAIPDFDEMDGKEKTKDELPKHLEEKCRRIKAGIAEVKIPLRWVWKKMVERGLIVLDSERSFGKVRNYCEFHHEEGHEIQECIEFRALVQAMMNDKEVEFYEEVMEEGSICTSESMKVPKVNHPVVIISRPKNDEAKVPESFVELCVQHNRPWKRDYN
ncbi:hypothetical protein Golax_023354 [Gossypium laxum]|uniref:Uncharacterized protein n=1 Tax=Gossypium laxum TaxID=34288 RepID=A0A7J9B0N0_9ROSI|nr:hypothetical protein [Gossypium laxum]